MSSRSGRLAALTLFGFHLVASNVRAELPVPNHDAIAIIRASGYTARSYRFLSQDNATLLSTIRITNPLFNNGKRGLAGRRPLIYLHGVTLGVGFSLYNAERIKPRDFSHLDVAKLSRRQLLRELGSDPSKSNLIFLALNFGHEVWLPSRRGFRGSRQRLQDLNRTLDESMEAVPRVLFAKKQAGGLSPTGGLKFGRPHGGRSKRSLGGHTSAKEWLTAEMTRLVSSAANGKEALSMLLSPWHHIDVPKGLSLFRDESFRRDFIETFNPEFWNFSLDEQAEYDLPAVVDFVTRKTRQKRAHLVGLSAGGAVILLGLSVRPELAEKVGAAVLWAPAVNAGFPGDIVSELSQLVPVFQTLVGPFPFTFMDDPLHKAIRHYCRTSAETLGLCNRLYGAIFGDNGGQELSDIWYSFTFVSSPGNELKHLAQMAHTDPTCKFSFNTAAKNMEVYGQPEPPCYDFAKIASPNLFFYGSPHDRLVTDAAIRLTVSQLSVNCSMEIIDEEGLRFNHVGYHTHRHSARLAVIPTLKNIASVEADETEQE